MGWSVIWPDIAWVGVSFFRIHWIIHLCLRTFSQLVTKVYFVGKGCGYQSYCHASMQCISITVLLYLTVKCNMEQIEPGSPSYPTESEEQELAQIFIRSSEIGLCIRSHKCLVDMASYNTWLLLWHLLCIININKIAMQRSTNGNVLRPYIRAVTSWTYCIHYFKYYMKIIIYKLAVWDRKLSQTQWYIQHHILQIACNHFLV